MDLQVEVEEDPGDIVEEAQPIVTDDLDDGVEVGDGVVHAHRRRLMGVAPGAGPGLVLLLGQADGQGQPAGQGPLHVPLQLGPLLLSGQGVGREIELKDGYHNPVAPDVDLGSQDVEPVQGHHPGQAAEETPPLPEGHTHLAVALGLLLLHLPGHLPALEPLRQVYVSGDGLRVGGQEVRVGDLVQMLLDPDFGQASFQEANHLLPQIGQPLRRAQAGDVGPVHGGQDAGVEFPDQRRLPGGPGLGAGGLAVGDGQEVEHGQPFLVADLSGRGKEELLVVDVPAGGRLGEEEVVGDEKPDHFGFLVF